jgi:predicted acylesterase/phospholipase RssA
VVVVHSAGSHGALDGVLRHRGAAAERVPDQWLELVEGHPLRLLDDEVGGERVGVQLLEQIAVVRVEALAQLPERWPDRDVLISTVDLYSGKRVAFGAPGAPPASFTDAVLASVAIPGVFRPVRIHGRLYVDGGVYSATSLDLATEAGGIVDVIGFKNGETVKAGEVLLKGGDSGCDGAMGVAWPSLGNAFDSTNTPRASAATTRTNLSAAVANER